MVHVGNFKGSASVNHSEMLLSCVTGLFQQAIVQSGSPLAFWAMHNESASFESFFRHYAKDHGCYHRNLTDLVECLRNLPWTDFNFELRYKVRH